MLKLIFTLQLPASLPAGKYDIDIGLFDDCQKRNVPIQLVLDNSRRTDDGYYKMGEILVK